MFTPLRFVRLGKDMKLVTLAKKVQISPSLLSKIENGKFRGSKKTRSRIARSLGISEEALFGTK